MSTRPPPGRDLSERLRINSCRLAHESPDEAASRRIKVELEAADEIERLTKSYDLAMTSRLEWRRLAEEAQSKSLTIEAETREACAVIADKASDQMKRLCANLTGRAKETADICAHAASEIATAIRSHASQGEKK